MDMDVRPHTIVACKAGFLRFSIVRAAAQFG